MEAAFTLKKTSNESNLVHGEPSEVKHQLKVQEKTLLNQAKYEQKRANFSLYTS